ncbi:MAG: hypothetical protein Q4D41_08740 [Prevotellaceae bacterium]|nr:hypothetical protein [Prevotellaceae bacterium]
MKKRNLFGLFLIGCIAAIALTFTACSEDDDDIQSGTFTYEISFTKFSGDGTVATTVTETFMTAMSEATDSSFKQINSSSFTLTGSRTVCDAEVKLACAAAEKLLETLSLNADFTLIITNTTTATRIYENSFASDGSNQFI